MPSLFHQVTKSEESSFSGEFNRNTKNVAEYGQVLQAALLKDTSPKTTSAAIHGTMFHKAAATESIFNGKARKANLQSLLINGLDLAITNVRPN